MPSKYGNVKQESPSDLRTTSQSHIIVQEAICLSESFLLQGAQEKYLENTSRKTEREKIQKHLLISMGAFAFAKVVWTIFFMLFEANTSVVIYGKFESEAHAAVDDEFPM